MPKETHVPYEHLKKLRVQDGDRVVVHVHPDQIKSKNDLFKVRQLAAQNVMKYNPEHRGGTIDVVADDGKGSLPSDSILKKDSSSKKKDG